MASEKQVQANRANAKRSTGPKSGNGKSISRMNACRHGLTAETIVIGDEDPKAFEALRAQLLEEYNPRPGIESELVERLASVMWRMRRIPKFEAALIEIRRDRLLSERRLFPDSFDDEATPDKDIAVAFQNSADTLGTLFRYEAALMNASNRTIQQLLVLQDRRAREEAEANTIDVSPS
jgi:hypothetical protein